MAPKRKDITPDQDTLNNVLVRSIPGPILEKMQTIANLEGVSFNDIYNLAFTRLIEAYEAKNGKVKVRPKGKGLEGI